MGDDDAAPEIRLGLTNKAENVGLVRHALACLADPLGIDSVTLADLKIAVSEACNNVVQHAYDGDQGPLRVDISLDADELIVAVHDEGGGIQPNPPDLQGGMQGVGLSLIQALTDRVEFLGGPDEGTAVQMAFAIPGLEHPERPANGSVTGPPPSGDVVISINSPALVGAMLGCVVSFLGAQAGFSLERVSEAQMLADAFGDQAEKGNAGTPLHAAVTLDGGALDIAIAPLEADGGPRLLREATLPSIGSLFERLADDVSIEHDGETEQLRLRVGPRG